MDLDPEYFIQPEWPGKPHDIKPSMCHWFPDQEKKDFQSLLAGLPPNPLYVELGTFLGAGSTIAALECRPDLQALCFDDFKITGNQVARHAKGNPHHLPTNFKGSDFAAGRGTALQHCQNNLWDYRGRVRLFKQEISHVTIDKLASSGVVPACVLIDDNHHKEPFVKRVFRCRFRWPKALIICDDYCKAWPGIMEGVSEVFKRGWYKESESKKLGRRMITFKRDR